MHACIIYYPNPVSRNKGATIIYMAARAVRSDAPISSIPLNARGTQKTPRRGRRDTRARVSRSENSVSRCQPSAFCCVICRPPSVLERRRRKGRMRGARSRKIPASRERSAERAGCPRIGKQIFLPRPIPSALNIWPQPRIPRANFLHAAACREPRHSQTTAGSPDSTFSLFLTLNDKRFPRPFGFYVRDRRPVTSPPADRRTITHRSGN